MGAKLLMRQLRSMDWVRRHSFWRHLRRHTNLAEAVEQKMGPDELLSGQNTSFLALDDDIIVLPDAPRKKKKLSQLTLHRFFFIKKKHTYQTRIDKYFRRDGTA